MTQAFWDKQFKFSEIIPDFAQAVQNMAKDSEDVTGSHQFSRTRYGDHPRQWVEWIGGAGNTDLLPVILHGGYWRALEAESHRFMMPAFRSAGAHVANIEYRLMPEVSLGDVVSDAKAALHSLSNQFPNRRLVLIGHSAGAHLALSAMADTVLAKRIAGIISLSGVFDLAPVCLSFLQPELHLTPEDVTAFSLLPHQERPPVLYVNGGKETYEYLRGGALMAQPENAAWHVIDDADHMSLTWAACEQADTLLSKLLSLGNTE